MVPQIIGTQMLSLCLHSKLSVGPLKLCLIGLAFVGSLSVIVTSRVHMCKAITSVCGK